MKRLCLLFSAAMLLCNSGVWGQVTANFDDNFSTSGYGNYTTGEGWSVVNGLSEGDPSLVRSGRAVRLRNSGSPSLTSPALVGGVGDISFWYIHWDGSPSLDFEVQTSTDGTNYTTIATFNNFSSTTYTEYTTTLNDPNIVRVRVAVTGASERLIIDDFTITAASLDPTVGFDAGASAETEPTSTQTINIPVTFSNYDGTPVTLDVTLGTPGIGNNTYEAGDVVLNTATLTFNANGTQNISLDLNPDADAEDEVVEITISEQTSTGVTLSTSVHTLTITDNQVPDAGDIVINEIHYNPAGGTVDEFLELYNASGTDLNLGNVTFTEGVTYTFPAGTIISAGEYIVLAEVASNYSGNGYTVYQWASGELSNSGESIQLERADGTVIDAVTYSPSTPWPTAPDGSGASLSLNPATQNATDNDNAANWGASCANNGTPGAANLICNAETEIVAVAGSESATISSLVNASSPLSASDGVQVWQFDINEGGSDLDDADNLPTIINSLTITELLGDQIDDWSDAIRAADLFDGTTHLGSAVIAPTTLTFTGAPLISVADGTSKRLTLRISLNTSINERIIDGEDFVCQISSANVITPADGTSSATSFAAAASTNDQNVIEVVATALAFATQPTDAFRDQNMATVVVNGIDANGNIDSDFATDVSITSSGTLTGTPVVATPDGVGDASFATLVHTADGAGLTLTASATGFADVTSSPFNITELVLPRLYISEISDADPFSAEFLEIYNDESSAVNLTGMKLIRVDGTTNASEYVFDFGDDGTGDVVVPAKGFLVVARGADRTAFETEFASFPATAAYNQGNGSMFFGATARRWRLRYNDGTPDTDDGTLLDDTQAAVAGSDNRVYQQPIGTFISDSDANATPGEFDSGQNLPVELLSFTAQLNAQKQVVLRWHTATELNNSHFVVERSTNGRDFQPFGEVMGAGTTLAPQAYQYIDATPAQGINYYRLTQVDYDGQATIHHTVTIQVGQSAEAFVLSPNPAHNDLTILRPQGNDAQLTITDLMGRVVRSQSLTQAITTVSVADLPAGQYIVRLVSQGIVHTQSLIKQ